MFHKGDFRGPFTDYLNESSNLQREIFHFVFFDLRCDAQKSFMAEVSGSPSRDDKPSPKTMAQMEMEIKKEKEKEASGPAPTYPSQRKQITIMAALYLALFLVTLVPYALSK
jgi:hypothetical protein